MSVFSCDVLRLWNLAKKFSWSQFLDNKSVQGLFSNLYASFSDINECGNTRFPCVENAECVNTDGGYNCICAKGYNGDGENYCQGNKACACGSSSHSAITET